MSAAIKTWRERINTEGLRAIADTALAILAAPSTEQPTATADGLPELVTYMLRRPGCITGQTESGYNTAMHMLLNMPAGSALVNLFTDDQMRAYGLARIAQAAPAGDAAAVLQVYRPGNGWHDVGFNEYIGTTSNNRRRLYAEPPAATERAATHPIAGLGSMTNEDDGILTLRFKDEDAAQEFMSRYSPTVDCRDMPERAATQPATATCKCDPDGRFGLAAATQPAGEVEPDAASEWRRLALQFDGHRMQALGHLRMMLQDHGKHAAAATEFLSAPPLSGEAVLAERIANLAPASPSGSTEQPADPAKPYVEVETGSFAELVLHAMYRAFQRGDSVERAHAAVMTLFDARATYAPDLSAQQPAAASVSTDLYHAINMYVTAHDEAKNNRNSPSLGIKDAAWLKIGACMAAWGAQQREAGLNAWHATGTAVIEQWRARAEAAEKERDDLRAQLAKCSVDRDNWRGSTMSTRAQLAELKGQFEAVFAATDLALRWKAAQHPKAKGA